MTHVSGWRKHGHGGDGDTWGGSLSHPPSPSEVPYGFCQERGTCLTCGSHPCPSRWASGGFRKGTEAGQKRAHVGLEAKERKGEAERPLPRPALPSGHVHVPVLAPASPAPDACDSALPALPSRLDPSVSPWRGPSRPAVSFAAAGPPRTCSRARPRLPRRVHARPPCSAPGRDRRRPGAGGRELGRGRAQPQSPQRPGPRPSEPPAPRPVRSHPRRRATGAKSALAGPEPGSVHTPANASGLPSTAGLGGVAPKPLAALRSGLGSDPDPRPGKQARAGACGLRVGGVPSAPTAPSQQEVGMRALKRRSRV